MGPHKINTKIGDRWKHRHGSTGGLQTPNYRPFAFRLWFLAAIHFTLLTVMALTELAVHVLPSGTEMVEPDLIIQNGTKLRARSNLSEPSESDKAALEGIRSHTNTELNDASVASMSSTSIENTALPAFDFKASTLEKPSQIARPPESSTRFSPPSETRTETLTEFSSAQPPMTSSSSQLPPSFISHSGQDVCTTTEYVITYQGWSTVTITVKTRSTIKPGSSSTTDRLNNLMQMPENTGPLALRSEGCDSTTTITKTLTKDLPGAWISWQSVPWNTVTVTVVIPDDENNNSGGNDDTISEDPTGTCLLTTLTVTDKVDFVAATTTVTADTTVTQHEVGARNFLAPMTTTKTARLRARACEGGGVRTVTESVAMPNTVTVTVWHTIIRRISREAGQLLPPSLTTWVMRPTVVTNIITSNGETQTRVSTRPAITTWASRQTRPPDKIPTAIVITSTDRRGDLHVTTVKGVFASSTGSGVSTTLIPFTSTDDNGKAVVGTKTMVFYPESSNYGVDYASSPYTTLIPVTWTDRNGKTHVSTRTHVFYPDTSYSTTILIPFSTTDEHGKTYIGTKTSVFVKAPQVLDSTAQTAADAHGHLGPSSTEDVRVAFITDQGLSGMMTVITTTMRDAKGRPTLTTSFLLIESVATITRTDSAGNPTIQTTHLSTTLPIFTGGPAPSKDVDAPPKPNEKTETVLEVYTITSFEYFTGLILPTLISTILTIPFRILDHVAKLYHPFYVLSSTESGAQAGHTICWKTMSPRIFITRFQLLFQGQYFLTITGTLVMLSSILVPISAEAVHLILQGPECKAGQGNSNNCAVTIGVFPIPARVCLALLGFMALLVLAVAVTLWRRHCTGVLRKPWRLSEMAELSSNPSLRLLFNQIPQNEGQVNQNALSKTLGVRTYTLKNWQDGSRTRYGVVPSHHIDTVDRKENGTGLPQRAHIFLSGPGKSMPFIVLTIWGRILILMALIGVLTIIITYNITSDDSSLDHFLSSETVLVRFLVTSVGMAVTLFWSSYFYSITFVSPYRSVHSNHSGLLRGIDTSLPTNIFSGFFRALSPGSRDVYLAAVAFTAFLADFLPALLSNVPYKVIQTWLTHMVCTWMAVSILGIMVLLIVVSFFIDWPDLPLDPSTVAGAMYYALQFTDGHKDRSSDIEAIRYLSRIS